MNTLKLRGYIEKLTVMMNFKIIFILTTILLTACSNEGNTSKEQISEKTTSTTDRYEDIRHMIEDQSEIDERLTEKNIVGVVGLIVGNGYSCDTISGIVPFPRKTGFYVQCNHFQYQYEVEDKGGNWVVTLK